VRAEKYNQLVVWDCDTCGRTQSRTISQMRSMVPSTKLICHGTAYVGTNGKQACADWTTAGDVMKQIEGEKYDPRSAKDRALPQEDSKF
jgi:hypothetical protein